MDRHKKMTERFETIEPAQDGLEQRHDVADMDEEKIDQLDKLASRLENSGVAEYVKLSQNTKKILWLNFISGIARGLGFTIGTTIVLAIVYKMLSSLISMNIPYLTELLKELVILIKGAG